MIYAVIAIIAALVFLAGHLNGWMDWIKFKQLDFESWKKKWRWFFVFENTDGYTKERKPYVKKWYYFGLFTPQYTEEYPFSSTILVFLTDAWHGRKWKMFLCYELIISAGFVYYNSLPWWLVPIGIIALKGIRGLGFISKYDKK